jgi:hypothetical protein
MPEMAAEGWAEVLEVGPAPPRRRGRGRRVTGKFRHERGVVGDLKVAGEPVPIGVTPQHLFRSADRDAWVPAGELRRGERLLAADGSTPQVESFTLRPDPEPVYNLEVEGDHCYRVGQQGLLVHNASCSDISSFSNYSQTFMFESPVGHGVPQYAATGDGKTRGLLVHGTQSARLQSGETEPGRWLTTNVQGGPLSGLTLAWTHVEGHAVSIMIQCCIMMGKLYINRRPCDYPPAVCQTSIPRLLPNGYVLEVVYETADGMGTGTGRFIGGVGWQEP